MKNLIGIEESFSKKILFILFFRRHVCVLIHSEIGVNTLALVIILANATTPAFHEASCLRHCPALLHTESTLTSLAPLQQIKKNPIAHTRGRAHLPFHFLFYLVFLFLVPLSSSKQPQPLSAAAKVKWREWTQRSREASLRLPARSTLISRRINPV